MNLVNSLSRYLYYFIISFFISFVCFFLLKKVGNFLIFSKRREERHIHQKDVCRLGGGIMIIVFILILLFSEIILDRSMYYMLFSLFFIAVWGIWDDLRRVHFLLQFLLQFGASLFIFLGGVSVFYIRNPFGGIIKFGTVFCFIFTILCIMSLMNIVNWLDGIDGLAGGVSGIGFLTIFFLSLRPEINQPPIAIMSIILFGISLSFLFFNFYPAKIMMGTTGSMFLGFMLAFLSILGGSKVATAALVMALPIIDAGWVIYQRIKHKKSIFEADKSHLHYRLLDLGLSQKQIALIAYFFTAVFSILSLFLSSLFKIVILLLITVAFIALFYYIDFVLQLNNNK